MTLITFSFHWGGINAVKYNLNPCHPSFPIMYQYFTMEAHADA